MPPPGVRRIAGSHSLDGLLPFRPRAPWIGGDLQTLRNALIAPPPLPDIERIFINTPLSAAPGQMLRIAVEHPAGSDEWQGLPLICLLHGLGGSEESRYIAIMAGALLRRGFRIARLAMRGSGLSSLTSRGPTHAGLASDINDALGHLAATTDCRALCAVGFSLGGHQLLRLAGEGGYPAALQSVMAISAPLDLATTSARIEAPRNAVYRLALVRAMRADARRWLAPDDPMRELLARLHSVRAIDEAIVAPAHGFRDAADYYQKASMQRHSARIAIPTFVLNAADDPWIPARTLRETIWPSDGSTLVLETASGGHVGFHAAGRKEPWYVDALLWWLRNGPVSARREYFSPVTQI